MDYLERSALQKDFVAFRVDRYGFADRLRILNAWDRLPAGEYDLVCALDVLEHVEDLEGLLSASLLPAVRAGGALAESSPFVRTLSNPMRHEHQDFDALMQRAGFRLDADDPACRVWRNAGD